MLAVINSALALSVRVDKTRLPHNAPGDLFVDASCINCDTCRWMAPDTFGHAAGKSYVYTQPAAASKTAALAAMVSCPTGSIRLERPEPSVRAVA